MGGRYFHQTGGIRFYAPGNSADDYDDYDGVVSVIWLDSRTVEFRMALSSDGFSRLSEAIEICREMGADRFRAAREISHAMPRPWRVIEIREKTRLWELDPKSANVAVQLSATNQRGKKMAGKAFSDTNVSKVTTEVEDGNGNLLWRVTREYGAILPAEEALAMEKILFSAAEEAKKALS